MRDPAVQTHELTKVFGAVTAVSKLSFSLYPGQILGFLGPNGAGKTTTIRMLLGALHPTGGSATVLGRRAGDVATHRRIGYLPGDLRVEPMLTGADLFSWYGRLRGSYDPRVVDALCERLDLDPTRRFGTLSKGNRQKVGIVLAFCHTPDLAPTDRREVRLTLTAAGRNLVQEVTLRRRDLLTDVVEAMPPAWHEPVAAALRSVAAAVGELPEREWWHGSQADGGKSSE